MSRALRGGIAKVLPPPKKAKSKRPKRVRAVTFANHMPSLADESPSLGGGAPRCGSPERPRELSPQAAARRNAVGLGVSIGPSRFAHASLAPGRPRSLSASSELQPKPPTRSRRPGAAASPKNRRPLPPAGSRNGGGGGRRRSVSAPNIAAGPGAGVAAQQPLVAEQGGLAGATQLGFEAAAAVVAVVMMDAPPSPSSVSQMMLPRSPHRWAGKRNMHPFLDGDKKDKTPPPPAAAAGLGASTLASPSSPTPLSAAAEEPDGGASSVPKVVALAKSKKALLPMGPKIVDPAVAVESK